MAGPVIAPSEVRKCLQTGGRFGSAGAVVTTSFARERGICEALFLSPKTGDPHVHRIFRKLGVGENAATHRRVLAVLAYLRGA